MKSNDGTRRYSAHVTMHLIAGEQTIELCQVAREWVMALQPTALDPCEADVVVNVDGTPHRRSVRLPFGMSVDVSKTRVVELAVPA